MQEVGELRATCRRLVGKLPAALKSDPDAIKLAAACSRATITEAWTAGLEDVRRSVSGWDKLRPAAGRHGVVVYRPTEDLPPSAPVAIPVKG